MTNASDSSAPIDAEAASPVKSTPSITELTATLHSVLERLDALEAVAQTLPASAHDGVHARADETDTFWALNTLAASRPEHPLTEQGAVLVAGSLSLPTGEPIAWQVTSGTEQLFELDWSHRASALAALGNPVRLEMLRAILSGSRLTSELAELDALGTTGQLHHHLRQLVAAGWVQQTGRAHYEVPPAKVVPLLALIAEA